MATPRVASISDHCLEDRTRKNILRSHTGHITTIAKDDR